MSYENNIHYLSTPKTIITILKPTFEETISHLANEINTYANEKHWNITLSITSTTFQIVTYILNKPSRSQDEILIIKTYLNSIPKFIAFLNVQQPEQILISLASALNTLKRPKYFPIIKYGEQGDCFYIILEGTVAVLIPKETYTPITILDYIKHLIMLKLLNEDELIIKTLTSNINIDIGVDIDDKVIYELIHCIKNKDYANIEIYGLTVNEIHALIDFCEYAIELVDNLTQFNTGEKLLSPEMYIKYTSPSFPKNALYEYAHKIQRSSYKKRSVHSVTLLNNNITTNHISSKNMSNYATPKKQKEEISKEITEVKLFLSTYIQVVTQNKGDSFGELALLNHINKRTATIICTDECFFGLLSRENYNSIMKDHQWRKRKNNVNFLLSFAIFRGMNWNYFESKLFNFFKFQTVYQGASLIKEGDKFERVYFIKEGLFELNINLSLQEVADLIHMKQPQIYLKPIEDIVQSKINFKLSIVNNRDIIGFNDITNKKIYFANVVCRSASAKVYSIDYEILSKISEKLPNFCGQLNNYVSKRENLLINRLVNLYNYHFVRTKKQEIENDENITKRYLYMKYLKRGKGNVVKYNNTQNEIGYVKHKQMQIMKNNQKRNCGAYPLNTISGCKNIKTKAIFNKDNMYNSDNNNSSNNHYTQRETNFPLKKHIRFNSHCINITQSRPNTSMNHTLKIILGRKYRNHPTSKAFEMFRKTLRESNQDDMYVGSSNTTRHSTEKKIKHRRNKEALVDLLYYDKNVIQDNPSLSKINKINYRISRNNKRNGKHHNAYSLLTASTHHSICDNVGVNEHIYRRIQHSKNARRNHYKNIYGLSNMVSFKSDDYNSTLSSPKNCITNLY